MRLFPLALSVCAVAQTGPPSVAVGITTKAPKIDGRIDPVEWADAARIEGLTQQIPEPGGPHRFPTTVLVMADATHLYFGFLCIDPEPQKIAVHTMRADEDLGGDDTVAVVLDSFGDARTGYFFRVNAAGARQDGLISRPTEEPSTEWTGIWDARTHRFAQGWMAEIVIPARTLNFKKGLTTWGLNLERHVARERLNFLWASPVRDALLTDLSRAGKLEGIAVRSPGVGLEFVPYVLGRRLETFGSGPAAQQATGGVDIAYRVTPDLNLVVTTNTDFAETEVDLRQNNTTRFPLFFPERRAFFLEGSNQFDFGLGLGRNFIPFFTRRVGLSDGRPVAIDVGTRLLGRTGRWNLAALNVQTRSRPGAPATNLTAARVSYDVSEQLRVGTLVTNGDPEGLSRNTFAGVDTVWRTSKFLGKRNLAVGGWAGGSASGPLGQGKGFGASVEFPNDLWWSSTSVNHYGAGLNPALGFLPRPATTQARTENWFQPRPDPAGRLGFVRQFYFGFIGDAVINTAGQTETWRLQFSPVSGEFQSGDEFEIAFLPQREFLPVPFPIAPGLTLPVGGYSFQRTLFSLLSSRFRRWRTEGLVEQGGFYRGELLQTSGAVEWTSPEGRWQARLSQEQNFGRLPQGNFVQRLWQTRLVYSPTPYFSVTSLFQFDSVSSNLGGNTRLQWMLRPGRELIFVWNRGWRQLPLRRDDLVLLPESEALTVKLRWTLRY